MIKTPSLTIIGGGNMGAAFVSGLIQNHFPPQSICVADISEEKLNYLQNRFGVKTASDYGHCIQKSDVILFAVKPQSLSQVLKDLASKISLQKPLLISIAAGISIKSIEQYLHFNAAIVRVMPNLPATIGKGISALYANDYCSPEDKKLAEEIIHAVGEFVWLDHENQIDTVTAISGSGPAYFFYLMESLQNAGHKMGLPLELVSKLVKYTALGASLLAIETKEDIHLLRQQVTSKGGTTEAALEFLKSENFLEIVQNAVGLAQKRAHELEQEFGQTEK